MYNYAEKNITQLKKNEKRYNNQINKTKKNRTNKNISKLKNMLVKGGIGIYSCSFLENYYLDIAAALKIELPNEYRCKSILHVMTESYNTGGHTRVVERWIDISPSDEVHSVLLTKQNKENVPLFLEKVVQEKKGEIIAYVDPSKPGSAYAVNPVVSTVTGTVISMPVNPGDTVSTSTVIGAVGSLRDLKITVYVSEKYSGYLKKGLNAFVSFTSMPGEEFSAKVTSVSPVVNNLNRTIETVLELDKYDSRIKPGMFATVSLVIQEEDNSFVVPKSAIKTYNTDSTVFVIDENNTAKRVVVTTGISNDNDIQITSGLEEGMQVITAGSATEGSPVKVAGGNK